MKNNWKHKFRTEELKIIFKNCPEKFFNDGLELGAGSGAQTDSLFKYCKNLTSSDFDEKRFNIKELKKKNNLISYAICDAENVASHYKENSIDLVYSSNLMEHLPDPDESFGQIKRVLKEDGFSISTMPSFFMKLLYLLFFYPALIISLYIKLKKHIFYKSTKVSEDKIQKSNNLVHDNNLKFVKKKRTKLSRLFPEPHGANSSNLVELFAWRKKKWIKIIENQNLRVIKTIKLPVTTGYSFKLPILCNILYKIGFCSSYCYVAVKNKNNPHSSYF